MRRTDWSAADLMAAQFPEPRWAIPDIVPEGLTLLAGAPKLGKSWLALNLAAAVGAGGRALGRVEVDAGDALYLALEDPPRRLQQRLRMVLEGGPVPPLLSFSTQWALMHDGGADALDGWLSERPGCRLVVVDVLAKVRGATSDKEARYDADYRCLSTMKEIADRHSVALVVVHHTRKQASEDYLDLVSGTAGLTGAADTIAVLSRSRGSADATLAITGRDVEETKHALNLNGGRWTILDGPAGDYEISEQRRLILDACRAEEGIGPKAIAEKTGISHDVVKQLVRKMIDSGQLDTDGAGHYFAPCSPFTPFTHSQRTVNAVNGEHLPWDDLEQSA